jgi:hypothetical protein
MQTDFLSDTDAEKEAKQLLKAAIRFYQRVAIANQRGYLSKKAMLFINDAGADLSKQMHKCFSTWDIDAKDFTLPKGIKTNMEIQAGNYLLRNGQIGHVWEKRVDPDEGVLWIGTVTDGGVETWDENGNDKAGYRSWDLAELMPGSESE